MAPLRRGRAAAVRLARTDDFGEAQGMADSISRIRTERRLHGERLQHEQTERRAHDDRARSQLLAGSEQSHSALQHHRCADVNGDGEIFLDCCETATVEP